MASPAPLRLARSGDDGLALRYYSVTSADGTVLRAWTNDVEGPTVLLCNGLGTNPYAWPALLDPTCGVRVISWNHRGTGGSQVPADRDRVGIDAFVEDAVAVLDDAGVERCVVMGWSMGVNTMFELVVQHPGGSRAWSRSAACRAARSPRCSPRCGCPGPCAGPSPSARPG